jgi:hypothetical protein
MAFVGAASDSFFEFIIINFVGFLLCVAILSLSRDYFGGSKKAVVKIVGKTYLAFALVSFATILTLLMVNMLAHSRGYEIVLKFGFFDVSADSFFAIFAFMTSIFSYIYLTTLFFVAILFKDQGEFIKKLIATMIWMRNKIHYELGEEITVSRKRFHSHSEWYYLLSSLGAMVIMLPVIIFSANHIVWVGDYNLEAMMPYAIIFGPALTFVTTLLMSSLVADRLGISKSMSFTLMVKPITLPFMLSLLQLSATSPTPFAQGIIISTLFSILIIFLFILETSRLITTGRETQLIDDIERLLSV